MPYYICQQHGFATFNYQLQKPEGKFSNILLLLEPCSELSLSYVSFRRVMSTYRAKPLRLDYSNNN